MRSFKRTIWKILAFLLSVAAITVGITEPYFQNEVYHYQDAGARDFYAGTLDVLICGSSHAYRGIVPQVLDEAMGCSSYNLSTSLMTMSGRYEMLKQELERNPVKLVILDVSFNSLTRDRAEEGPEGDIYQLGRYRSLPQRLSYFFRHFRLEEYGRVYYDTLNRGVTTWKLLLRGQGKLGSSEKYQTKGFMPGPSNPCEEAPYHEYHTYLQETEFNGEDVAYMEKMVELCRERDIPVIVVAVPIAQRLTLLFDGLDSIHTQCQALCSQWGVPFYDFNLYRGKTRLFPDDTAYFDVNHMSESGARDFTGELCRLLEALEAGADPSGWFYDSYSEAEVAALRGYDDPVPGE